jgi:hypothetical protein
MTALKDALSKNGLGTERERLINIDNCSMEITGDLSNVKIGKIVIDGSEITASCKTFGVTIGGQNINVGVFGRKEDLEKLINGSRVAGNIGVDIKRVTKIVNQTANYYSVKILMVSNCKPAGYFLITPNEPENREGNLRWSKETPSTQNGWLSVHTYQ